MYFSSRNVKVEDLYQSQCNTFVIASDPLELLSDEEKEHVGKMHILDLPINARRVVRDVTLHGNATWVLLCILVNIKYHFHICVNNRFV